MSTKNQSAIVALMALFVLGISAIVLMSYRLFYVPSPSEAAPIAATGTITVNGGMIFAGFNENIVLSDGQGTTVTYNFVNFGGGFHSCTSGADPNCTQYNVDIGGGVGDNSGNFLPFFTDFINTTTNQLQITAVFNVDDNRIDLTNDVAGEQGNIAITETVANEDFVVTGMSGGGAGNAAPTVALTAVSPSQVGTGEVSIQATVNDADDDTTRLKLEYTEGADCSYSSTSSAGIADGALGVNTGALTVNGTAEYQVQGIDTSVADEFVSLTLDLKDSLPNADGTYCIHVTPNDGTSDGTRVTSTVLLDNVAPTTPGDLVVASTGTTAVVFTLPTGETATDTRFSRYTIFYTEGTSEPTTTDSQLDGLFESDLAVAAFGAPTTTITGLTAGTQYTANLFAYDTYGNFSSATNSVTFTLQSFPTATLFSVPLGTTNFASSSDVSAVTSMKLAKAAGAITWTGPVSAIAENYDTGVLIGTDYVSVNTAALDSSISSAASIEINDVTSCDNYTIYSAAAFYSSANDIITNGQACNAGTDPACTVVSCADSTLTFTVEDFSSKSFAISSSIPVEEEEEAPAPSSGGASSYSAPAAPAAPAPTAPQTPNQLPQTPEQEQQPNPNQEAPVNQPNEQAPVVDNENQAPVVQQLVEVDSGVKCSLARGGVYRTGIREQIFYVDNECRRGRIRNAAHYFTYFDSFSAVQLTSQDLLDKIPFVRDRFLPIGPKFTPEEGDLIKILSSPRVYVVQNNTRRWIPNAQIFQALGFQYNQVLTVVPQVLSLLPLGPTVVEGEEL